MWLVAFVSEICQSGASNAWDVVPSMVNAWNVGYEVLLAVLAVEIMKLPRPPTV